MNYDNNLNPNDTISSLDKGMASGGGVGKQENPRQLRRRFTAAMVALLLTFLAVSSATYAWYIYNTSRHTTNVRMAAGAGVNLQISNSYSGTYGSAAVLDSFAGQLVPVSTNRISGGFQKVLGFTEEQAQEQFGFLLTAFKYGVPPHAGLAYGLDRLVMLMAKQDSIRDVIAFPKVKDASDLMTEAPGHVDAKQLEELGIAVVAKEEKKDDAE